VTEPINTAKEKSGSAGFMAELKRRKVVRVAIVYAVVGWLVIQVANTTFEGFGIPSWAFRFVALMVVLGLPVSLVIAWAFELTPDGVKLTKTAIGERQGAPVSTRQERKRNWFSLGFAAALPALIFGILALVFYVKFRNAQNAQFDKSIAVLPFDNRSEQTQDQYFTDGIHDDLLTHISHIRDIKTISRTSVMGYRDTTKNLRTIGEELGVATILEGGVQRAGN